MARPPPKTAGTGIGSSEPRPKRKRTSLLLRAAASVLLGLALAGQCRADQSVPSCEEWHAEIIAVEGTVEVSTASGWKALEAGSAVCTADSVRVSAYSRAAILLPDKTVLRLHENTSLTFSESTDDTGSWIDLLRGLIHVISRDPRSLKFNTPYANAGLEGTEFVLEVNDHETEVTVVEGEVSLRNDAGLVYVPSGQRGSAAMAQRPSAEPVPDPIEALRWTPHFVPILGDGLPSPDQQPGPQQSASAAFFSRRAASRLMVGQIAAARSDLARALQLDPRHGEALALEALIALAEGRNAEGLELGRQAVDAAPSSVAAWLALSYAQEANASLEPALASANRALELDAGNALAWARLAELRLAAGNQQGARAAAQKALILRPDLAYAHTVLGFAGLAGEGAAPADASFREAVSLDPTAPLPRLGLGLALIRRGDLGLGREQLEIAVMLDPTNALSRSYMAKTYDAELRGNLSAAQLEIAKRLDGTDPTPWLYDAVRKQNENRPVEALHDLQAAIDRNGNVGVFRSRLLVDEDLASRSAGIGQIHRTLGFEELALLEGWRSLAADPDDYPSHRLLADVYSHLPRHEMARVDELFQSQLLQPLNVTPVRPQLGETNLFVLNTLGPSTLAFSEFHPLIEQNGLSFLGSAVAASNGTGGVDVAVAGLQDKVSYSVGLFDYSTDGFRDNNDFAQRIANALVQFRPNHGTSVLTELRSSRFESGDLALLFDPSAYNPSLRQDESLDTVRIGIRHALSERGTLLGAVIADRSRSSAAVGPNNSVRGHRDSLGIQLEHVTSIGRWRLTTGGQSSVFDVSKLLHTLLPTPEPPFGIPFEQRSDYDERHSSIYSYGTLSLPSGVSLTLGASLDSLAEEIGSTHKVNPKLGLAWEPAADTTVRAVAFSTLRGPFLSKHSLQPSLEPTQLLGFNQRLFGPAGEQARHYGAALDHRFAANLYGGVEISKRDLSVPYFVPLPEDGAPIELRANVDEVFGQTHLYWTPSTSIAVSGAYQYEHVDTHGNALPDRPSRVTTTRLPVSVRYFHGSGFSGSATTTWIRQEGDFALAAIGGPAPNARAEESFWTLDLSLGYRLPNRHGIVSLNVNNALDRDFRFQDTDPENPRILAERTVLLRISLSY